MFSYCFGGRGSACSEESECRLCVCFLAFLHPLPCCWNNSFWEPVIDLTTIKTKADFYIHFENTQDRRRGRISSCTSLFFENVVTGWVVTYQHLKLCSKDCHVTESGFRARWYFHSLYYRPKPGWCHGSGCMLCRPFWTKSLITGPSGLPSPAWAALSLRSILLFQCVAKHDLGFSWGGAGGICACVYFLWSTFEDDQDWTNVSGQTFIVICLLERTEHLGFPGDTSNVAQLQRVQRYFYLSNFELFHPWRWMEWDCGVPQLPGAWHVWC